MNEKSELFRRARNDSRHFMEYNEVGGAARLPGILSTGILTDPGGQDNKNFKQNGVKK